MYSSIARVCVRKGQVGDSPANGRVKRTKTFNLVLRTETVYKITKLLCNKKGEEEKKKTLLIVKRKKKNR